MEKSGNRALAEMATMMEGAARRFSLPGNPIELKGTRLDGSPFDWAAYKGKVVLVDFWTASDPLCRIEIANAKKNYLLYHDRGFEVVGVNLDKDRQEVEEFLLTLLIAAILRRGRE
jgi:cytochrome oxidase Cu insertion factor (SCO1/SenC/PrrC family)